MRNILNVTVLLTISSAASAQVAYTNFGTSDSYNTVVGWSIGGASDDTRAMQWTSLDSGVLAGIRFASWYTTGSTDLQIQLREDSSNTVGAVMKTWNITQSSTTPTITALTNVDPSVLINTGSTYWLEMSSVGSGQHNWNFNDLVTLGRMGTSNDDGATWSYAPSVELGVFDVRVTPVPEPATMIAFGLGASAFIARRRRKKA